MYEPDRDAPDEPIEETDEGQEDVELHGQGGVKGGHTLPYEPPAVE